MATNQLDAPFTLQHYLIVWTFPTVEGAWESSPGFAEYINAGAPGDVFDGFALKYRVCEPISGSGVAIAVASDIGKVWAHLGPWIKDFGISSMSPLWFRMPNLLPCGRWWKLQHPSTETALLHTVV